MNTRPPTGHPAPATVPIDLSADAFGADSEKIGITVFVTFEVE